MAAPGFDLPYQYIAMSTGTGAQRADVAGPWQPSLPSIRRRQEWEASHFHADSQPPFLPLLDYTNNPYPHPNYPQSPYHSHTVNGGPPMQMYPQSMYTFSSHQPRPPPAIRSGHVDALLNPGRPGPDMHRLPTNHGMHHRSTPSAFAYSMPPQPAVPGGDTPSVSFERTRSPETVNAAGVEHSDQARPSHFRSSGTNQSQESERSQQQPTVRNIFMGRTEHAGSEQSQQRPAVHNTFMGRIEDSEQRMPRNLSTQTRRSDRSSSPRASARRSFNRYSADLSHSGTSSDVEEAAARSPPFNRARHQRTDSRSRLLRQAYDPRIITGSQLQQLTASLPRLLRDELPDDTSPTCDICAKDYSAVPVQPSEEEEVAVKLPCGHCFGESCITEWVCIAQFNRRPTLTLLVRYLQEAQEQGDLSYVSQATDRTTTISIYDRSVQPRCVPPFSVSVRSQCAVAPGDDGQRVPAICTCVIVEAGAMDFAWPGFA